ncbi:MAG: twin-arginine translocation signal domain-containing protein [Eggerthella lenta]
MAEQATHGFTRRSFIKGAAALTAAGALVGCSPQTQNLEKAEPQKDIPETQIFSGVCRGNCAGGCFLNVHVRDGQVVPYVHARDARSAVQPYLHEGSQPPVSYL